MRRTFIGVAITLSALQVLAQNQASAEFTKLQGAWTVTASERNGKADNSIKGGVLTITDHRFALHTAAGNDFKGELKIDAAASPHQLDFLHENGTTWQAIYTVDDDIFKLNYVDAASKEKRPTIFATSAGSGSAIVVMKRN